MHGDWHKVDMNIFAVFIRRPVGTSLLGIGLMLAGLWAYLLLGVAALPSLDFPGVYVVANQPGASAQTMANTVLAPLERHLGRVPGIDDIFRIKPPQRQPAHLVLHVRPPTRYGKLHAVTVDGKAWEGFGADRVDLGKLDREVTVRCAVK